jgi:hypothetical protein
MAQMGKFLLPDREDDAVQFAIAISEKMELVVEVTMHRRFNRGRAGPYPIPAETGRDKSKKPTAKAPELHHAAGSRMSGRHRRSKDGAVIAFVPKHFGKRRATIRPKPSGHQKLRGIDPDSPEFTGMIDLDDASNRERVARIDLVRWSGRRSAHAA